MLKNYIVTAWKVFLRRKLFTFINLFGISLTLAVIMVASTIAESYLYPTGPEKMSGNYRVIDRLTLTNEDHSQTYGGRLGYKFIQDNIMRLKSPELMSFNTGAYQVAIYQDDIKLSKSFRRTDANYWQILAFNFVEGRPYDKQELETGQFVAVINQQLARELFDGASALGKTVEVNNQRFDIIGVVENVSAVEMHASADIWLPYTTMPSTAYRQEIRGSWEAILYHSNPAMLPQIQQEYVHMLKHDLILENIDDLTRAFGGAFSKLEAISSRLFSDSTSFDTGLETLLLVIFLLIVLFMLLPSINMINLNVSRIMERASEIGVRKAFGASSVQLVSQFLVESVVITFVGGVLGFGLSQLLLQLVEASGLIPYAQFGLNWRVLIWGTSMILLFALISGAYPAIKMSRLNPVFALKGGA